MQQSIEQRFIWLFPPRWRILGSVSLEILNKIVRQVSSNCAFPRMRRRSGNRKRLSDRRMQLGLRTAEYVAVCRQNVVAGQSQSAIIGQSICLTGQAYFLYKNREAAKIMKKYYASFLNYASETKKRVLSEGIDAAQKGNESQFGTDPSKYIAPLAKIERNAAVIGASFHCD